MRADGYLRIAAWDNESRDEPFVSTVDYSFAEILWWKRMPEGLMMKFDWGTTTILWHQILNYDVHGNSDEYCDWVRDNMVGDLPGQQRFLTWAQLQEIEMRERHHCPDPDSGKWQVHPRG